ncbi:unnamed protein product [Closterium sp. NIES-65]|nr:unnamed protein product [Closterium sp. NIES-65]
MEDIGKMDWAKDIVAKVKGGKGKQVLKLAGTRFGTQFIAVQRLCEVRSALMQMVLSPEWQAWAKGRKPPVEPFATMIMDAVWWKGAEFFVALPKIPFAVMRKIDSTAKGMMGRMYDLMLQLTEDINAKLEEEEEAGLLLSSSERTEVTNIVQKRWDHSMACAMHVVGRILNPVNQEEGIFRTDLECTRVFKAFVARHYAGRTVTRKEGEELRASHVIQVGLTAFNTLQGSFGLPDAISGRELVKAGKKTVVQWWTWHGTEHPELTTLACRVLSQPVSASACERNWAVWESIHTAKRNSAAGGVGGNGDGDAVGSAVGAGGRSASGAGSRGAIGAGGSGAASAGGNGMGGAGGSCASNAGSSCASNAGGSGAGNVGGSGAGNAGGIGAGSS